MDVTPGPRITPRRVALAATAACAVLVVAACGTHAAGHGALPGAAGRSGHHTSSVMSPSASSALCTQAGTLSQVLVTHSFGEPTGHVPKAQPATMTVRDRATVRPLARALCGLPPMSAGVMHCPMDTGVNYRLLFSRPGHAYPPVVVDMTGCHGVTGLGKTRTWINRPSLAHTLAKALSGHVTVIGG